MFDVAPSEFFIVALIALVVIGPKDLPKAMRVLGYWVGRARGVARQFRSGFDEMVRESELAEMEKKWAAENARIMAEHGAGAVAEATPVASAHDAAAAGGVTEPSPSDGVVSFHIDSGDLSTEPMMVEKPVVVAGPAGAVPAADNKADS